MQLELISKIPARQVTPVPLLFVHGAWHGAWCWNVHFMDYFAERGFSVHALSLRGHGSSEGRAGLRWSRVADYVADVAQVAKQLPAPPLVIGHSMGGHVVQKYLELYAAPAAILLASLPPAGALATTMRIARRHPLLFARVNLTMSLLPLVATPALARELFFSDQLPEPQLEEYWKQMQDESFLGFLDMLALYLPRPARVTTPVLVLGGADDRIFLPYEVEATALAYRTKAEIFPGMAHDLMLEPGWDQVARRMAAWIATLGLPKS